MHNASSARLMQFYRSDSRGAWRSDPVADLRACRSEVAQLLTHPIWWGDTDQAPTERIAGFLQANPAVSETALRATIPGVFR